MKITVTRTYEPVTREVTGCLNCPYFYTEPDMSMTLCGCQHPDFHNGHAAYQTIIPDVKSWGEPIFSKHCPLVKISVDKSQKGHECITC